MSDEVTAAALEIRDILFHGSPLDEYDELLMKGYRKLTLKVLNALRWVAYDDDGRAICHFPLENRDRKQKLEAEGLFVEKRVVVLP